MVTPFGPILHRGPRLLIGKKQQDNCVRGFNLRYKNMRSDASTQSSLLRPWRHGRRPARGCRRRTCRFRSIPFRGGDLGPNETGSAARRDFEHSARGHRGEHVRPALGCNNFSHIDRALLVFSSVEGMNKTQRAFFARAVVRAAPGVMGRIQVERRVVRRGAGVCRYTMWPCQGQNGNPGQKW